MDIKSNESTEENPSEEETLSKEEIEKLQTENADLTKKQSDLNQGIAKYRDSAQVNEKRDRKSVV